MSKQDFKIKKGLNVGGGRFVVNENEVSIDGVDVVDAVELGVELGVETTNRQAADVVLQGNIDVVVSALATAISNGIDDLTADEVTQLANIDTTTVSIGQWGYVGGLDQGLSTTDTVAFSTVTTNSIIGNLNTDINISVAGEAVVICNTNLQTVGVSSTNGLVATTGDIRTTTGSLIGNSVTANTAESNLTLTGNGGGHVVVSDDLDVTGDVAATSYSVGATAGATGGTFTTITSITVTNGIITAISGT